MSRITSAEGAHGKGIFLCNVRMNIKISPRDRRYLREGSILMLKRLKTSEQDASMFFIYLRIGMI